MTKYDRDNIVQLIRATAHAYAYWWMIPLGGEKSAATYKNYADSLTATLNEVERIVGGKIELGEVQVPITIEFDGKRVAEHIVQYRIHATAV